MVIGLHGIDVYYEQHGQGEANVLLLHGWGCSTELWKPVVAQLSPYARLTVVDFPGHGRSGRPPEPWGASDFSDMIALFIEALDIRGCHVIGHSHGGRTALLLAAKRPELLGKLVMTGAAGLRGEPTEEQKKRQDTFKRMRGLADAADRLHIFGSLPEKAREALRRKYGSRDYNALDAEMRRTFVKVVNFNIEEWLPGIQSPTLLVWGDRDTETPLWMGQKMEELIPDAGLVLLKNGTHYAYLEQCDRFCRIVQHFLFGGNG